MIHHLTMNNTYYKLLQDTFLCKALKTSRMILKHDLKEANAVQYIQITCANRQDVNISNKKAKCPFILNKKANMYQYWSPA